MESNSMPNIVAVVSGLVVFTVSVIGSPLHCGLPLVAQTMSKIQDERTIGEIRRHSREAIKSFRNAESSFAFVASTLDLCWLHTEITLHSDFVDGGPLQNIRAQLESVLRGAAEDIEVTIRQISRSGDSSRFQRSSYTSHASRAHAKDALILAQWESMQTRWLDQVTGGPLATLGQLPGNFAPPFTDRELIDLITSTVDPSSWRINGGEGEIQYYSPALALIVFNSMKVQDEVHDLLLRLR
jgi:hypothetical protein